MSLKKDEAVIRSTNMKWDYYARGFTLQELADKYGISRTMCHRIIRRPTTFRINTDVTDDINKKKGVEDGK